MALALTLTLGALPPSVEKAAHGLNSFSASMDGDLGSGAKQKQPGFKNPIFSMSASPRKFDDTLDIPKGWDFKPQRGCDFNQAHTEVYDTFDYLSSVHAKTTSKHHFLFFHSSHSKTFSAINQAAGSRSSMFTRKSATCTTYQLRRTLFDGSADLDPAFRTDVGGLPASAAEYNDPTKRAAMAAFLDTYGDTVLTQASFGGRATELTEFSRESWWHLKKQWGDLRSSSTLNLICRSGEGTLCDPSNRHWDAYTSFRDHALSNNSLFIPFAPEEHDLAHGGHNWTQRLATQPEIISYETESVANVLTFLHFPNDNKISGRREMLLRYIGNGSSATDWCADAPDTACPKPGTRHSRWTEPVGDGGKLHGGQAAKMQAGSAALGDSLYFVGGHTDSSWQNDDGNTPSVRVATDLSADPYHYFTSPYILDTGSGGYEYWALGGNAVASTGTSIVSTGGCYDDTTYYYCPGSAHEWSPAAGAWAELGLMPVGLTGHCMVNVDGVGLLTIGGRQMSANQKNLNDVASVYLYVRASNSWVPKQTVRNGGVEQPTYAHSCSVRGQHVYVVGGVNTDGGPIPEVRVYDASSDTWLDTTKTIPSMAAGTPDSKPRYRHGAAIVNDHLFVMGGWSKEDGAVLDDVHVLDLKMNEWRVGCKLPEPAIDVPSNLVVRNASAPGSFDIHVLGASQYDAEGDAYVAQNATFLHLP